MTDLDRLMAVMEASFDPHYREAWTRRQVEDSLALPSTFAILIGSDGKAIVNEGEAIGFALARQAADEVELLLVAVHPDRRGKGLGCRLLDMLLQQSRDRGASQIFLEMRAGNPAENLYRALGFDQIGRRRDYYHTITGASIDALTFARKL